MTSPLADFWTFAKDFRSLSKWIVYAATAAPLIGIFVGISPPWPSEFASSVLAAVFECLILMLTYEYWCKGRTSIKNLKRLFVLFFLFFVFFVFAYMFILAYFVVEVIPSYRVVIGYEYLPNMIDFAGDYTPTELLEMFECNAKAVWTSQSVSALQFFVLILWLLLWVSLSGACSVFIAIQSRRAQRFRN